MTESNLSEISNEIIRAALVETIEEKLKSKKHNIIVSSASTAGESNFIGIVYRVAYRKESETQTFKLILKIAPENEARRAQFQSRQLFLQEILTYNTILPSLRQFEKLNGLNDEEIAFNVYPRCYRTVTEASAESLLLEDLGVRDFKIIDRYSEEITVDHVYLVMRALAKFHAISFAFKDKQPKKFMELASQLKENFIRVDNIFARKFFSNCSKAIFKVLSKDGAADLLSKLNKWFHKDAIDVAFDCLQTSSGAVIAHGDVWQNNTMFKYDPLSGNPIDVSIVDWQMCRYSSPVVDIVYFMFCCTTKEFRDVHYANFLKVYHETLVDHIRRLGSDPEELFHFSLMQEHLQKFGKYGLIMSSILLSFRQH